MVKEGTDLTVHLVEDRGCEISPWGRGNRKLGASIYSYSKLPGRVGGSCPGSTAECELICYAKRVVANRPVWDLWTTNTERGDEVPPLPPDARVVRFHVSGDFDTVAYVWSWYRLALAHPDVRMFGYTRSWRVEAAEEHDRPVAHGDCEEWWKAVVGWEGIYEVSTCGNVRRIKQTSGTSCEGVLSQKLSGGKKGKRYPTVALSRHSQVSNPYVHRLVIEAFHGSRPRPTSEHEVNHRNWNRLDNHPRNLEWVTRGENMQHAVWGSLSLTGALERLRDLPNVQLFASVDESMDELPPAGWRVAWLETDPRARLNGQDSEHNWRPVDWSDVGTVPDVRTRAALVCPEETGRKRDCVSCNYCILGKRGDVVFLIH